MDELEWNGWMMDRGERMNGVERMDGLEWIGRMVGGVE